MKRTLMSIVIVLAAGCIPGEQVRRGLGQYKEYGWDDSGTFSVLGEGAQTERFRMAQGQIKMMAGPDGKPTIDWEHSVIEYYLEADPSAEDAGSALVRAAQESTNQVEILAQTIREMFAALLPLLVPAPAPAVP